MTPIYCMPGMCAKPTIFEYLKFPKEKYQVYWLHWIMPTPKESIEHYSKRICQDIHHPNPILLGVSLGGLIVQEIQRIIPVKKLILISTVKSRDELPHYMKLGQELKLDKILPYAMVKKFKKMESWPIGKWAKGRLHIYNRYLAIDDKQYLKWATETILNWHPPQKPHNFIHIAGSKDHIFPLKYLKDPVVVKGGTHLMIIDRFRWFNENLPRLLEK